MRQNICNSARSGMGKYVHVFNICSIQFRLFYFVDVETCNVLVKFIAIFRAYTTVYTLVIIDIRTIKTIIIQRYCYGILGAYSCTHLTTCTCVQICNGINIHIIIVQSLISDNPWNSFF